MKVLFSHDVCQQHPSDDFYWFYSFKFNDAKREYGINDPIRFEHIPRVLEDLVDRLIIEESIDQIILYVERCIDDDFNNCDTCTFVICRDDYKLDEEAYYKELHVEWNRDLVDLIEQKVLEVTGASSIK